MHIFWGSKVLWYQSFPQKLDNGYPLVWPLHYSSCFQHEGFSFCFQQGYLIIKTPASMELAILSSLPTFSFCISRDLQDFQLVKFLPDLPLDRNILSFFLSFSHTNTCCTANCESEYMTTSSAPRSTNILIAQISSLYSASLFDVGNSNPYVSTTTYLVYLNSIDYIFYQKVQSMIREYGFLTETVDCV